jgi:hypothetical protein
MAGSATNAQVAMLATNALNATNATYAVVAGSATNALNATNATYAVVAGTASNATWASVAANATNAESATTAGSAGTADSANYAGYIVGDLGYAFGYVTPSGFYSDDGMGGAQTWYLYGPLRILSGNWSNTGTFVVNGAQTNHSSLTVLGGGNVVTNGATGVTLTGTLTPTNALTVTNSLQLGGIAAGTWSNTVFAAVTNIFGFPFYSLGTSATQDWQWINEAVTITQVWGRADVANSCTVTLYALAVHTNDMATGTIITNLVMGTTNKQVDCSYTIPANGALVVSFGAGYAGVTNGNVRCKGVTP